MIRVLHIVGSLNRGGAETLIMNLYRNIDRKMIQFDFLKTTNSKDGFEDEILDLGGRIYNIPSRKNGYMKNKKALDNFFKNHPEYKIVHQHVSSLSYIKPLKIAKKYGVPIRIVHSHNTKQGSSNFLKKIMHYFSHYYNQKNITKIATEYFACSKLAAKWLYGKKLYNNNIYKIINNGIDPEKFKFDREIREKVRNEFNFKDEIILGHVGRFHPQKNHEFLIEIFNEFQKLHQNSKLLLVGDGMLKNHIIKKVDELGLMNKVIFAGVRSDVPLLLQAMDIFVMPSLYEGLPVTIIEAQAAGLPCLLSSNITKEVSISDIVFYLSLKDSPKKWSEFILNKMMKIKRENKKEVITKAGYDIREIAKNLELYYEISYNKLIR